MGIGVSLVILLQLALIYLMMSGRETAGGYSEQYVREVGENCTRIAADSAKTTSTIAKVFGSFPSEKSGGATDCTTTTFGGRTLVIVQNNTPFIGIPRLPGGAPGGQNGQPPANGNQPGNYPGEEPSSMEGDRESNQPGTYPGEDASTMEGAGPTPGGNATTPPGSSDNGCYTLTICDQPAPTCPVPNTAPSCQPSGYFCGSNDAQGRQCCPGLACVNGYCMPPGPNPTPSCLNISASCATSPGAPSCCAGLACTNGLCQPSTTTGTCSDSDGGKNTEVLGNATGRYNGQVGTYYDFCDTGLNEEYEYYCTGNGDEVKQERIRCANGCLINTCRPAPQDTSCRESDSGRDYYVRGNATGNYSGNFMTQYDACDTTYTNLLYEYYCTGEGNRMDREDKNCDYGCSNGACIRPSCSDSDGANYFVAGSVAFAGQTYGDYCQDSSTLVEYKCGPNGYVSEPYACAYGCDANACRSQPAPMQCSDTDNGQNYTQTGTVVGPSVTGGAASSYTDSCTDGYNVREYYCAGGLVANVMYYCTSPCVNGACSGSPPSNPPPQTCSDSDGGKNYNVKGTVDSGGFLISDYCDTTNGKLREYYCFTNGFNSELVSCPQNYYCSNGACVLIN